MYGREELEPMQDLLLDMGVDVEGNRNYQPWTAYDKDEADSVMDAMEARIKHLESILDLDPRTNLSLVDENQQLRSRINELEKRLEDVLNTMATENVDLGMENFKLKERIKELEAVISKMETTTPKWICVNAQDGEFTCTSCAEYANHDVLDFIEKLQAENERLQGEVNRLEATEESLADEQVKILDERDELRKENAKLKCLALHGMIGYAVCKMNLAAEKYKDDEMSAFAVPVEFSKWHRKEIEWTKAYRKAKAELMEGK